MAEHPDPVDAAVRAWTARLERQVRPDPRRNDQPPTDPVTEAQAIARALEEDLAVVLATANLVAGRAAELETGAIDAVRAGDDATARRLMAAQRKCAESVEELQADANVIRAMLAECQAAVAGASKRTSGAAPPQA